MPVNPELLLAAPLSNRMRDLERRVSTLGSSRGSTLRFTSAQVVDAEGNVRSVIGAQPDGSVTVRDVGAARPPVPSVPVVAGGPGYLRVVTDGRAAAGAYWPVDVASVVVHMDPDPAFAPAESTRAAALLPAPGGVSISATAGSWTVRLVAVNTSGAASAPTAPVTVTVSSIEDTTARADAAEALAAATSAEAKADGAVTTFYGATAPAAPPAAKGDFWVDDAGQSSIYSGTAWTPVTSTAVAAALTAARDAEAAADGKITTFYAPTAPAAGALGDLWFDTDDANKLYRWSGTAWVLARDTGIAAALSAASTAQTAADRGIADAADAQATADGKVRSFFQTTAPTGLVAGDVGDLWFDTDDGNRMYRWSGTAWVASPDTRIAQALTDAAAAATAAGNAQTTANAKITTFYQAAAPAATGRTPGDLWVDTDDANRLYRWSGTAWVDARDGTIATAQTAANTALTTANGKNKVFYQTTPPAGPPTSALGDLWFDTDNDNKAHRLVPEGAGFAWAVVAFGDAALSSLTVGKLVTGSLAAGTEIIAGAVTGNHMRLSPAELVAWRNDGTPTAPVWSRPLLFETSTGNLTLTGDLESRALNGRRVKLTSNLDFDGGAGNSNTEAGILFRMDTAVWRWPQMYAIPEALRLDSPAYSDVNGNPQVGVSLSIESSGIYGYTEKQAPGGNQDALQVRNDGVVALGRPTPDVRPRLWTNPGGGHTWWFGNGDGTGVGTHVGGSGGGAWYLGHNGPSLPRTYGNELGEWFIGHPSQQSVFSSGTDLIIRGRQVGGDVQLWMPDEGTWANGGAVAGNSWFDVWSVTAAGVLTENAKVYVHGVLAARDKRFVDTHWDPAKADTHLLTHSTLEGPELGVYYRGRLTLGDDGTGVAELPDYTEHLPPGHEWTITFGALGGPGGDPWAEPVAGHRFVVHGRPGATIGWLAVSARGELVAEMTRDSVNQPDEPDPDDHPGRGHKRRRRDRHVPPPPGPGRAPAAPPPPDRDLEATSA